MKTAYVKLYITNINKYTKGRIEWACKVIFSKYEKRKSEFVSHININSSAIFDTQTWIPKQRCDQVPAGSKHHLSIIHTRHVFLSVE